MLILTSLVTQLSMAANSCAMVTLKVLNMGGRLFSDGHVITFNGKSYRELFHTDKDLAKVVINL